MLPGDDRHPSTATDDAAEIAGHPRGTLAIVLIYALLFAVGWFALFLFRFMEQGAPHQH